MSGGRRLRRPSSEGHDSGAGTRTRVIAGAIELFGARGFKATSTQDIAVHVGVAHMTFPLDIPHILRSSGPSTSNMSNAHIS
ncbi:MULTISPECIES: TetR/AcrR family transcriptional regulator [Burkholderia cepacia complex]|uniref:TetR family transcriptional regulator n=1 Tax=Burkholderia seminalis TaxID=488731 RepID=A0A8A8DEX1_9BURK|nr:TetR family transcriptional regulator [Burkholderia seminalis]